MYFTVPKLVLINRPKMPQNLSAQIICLSPTVWDFDEKRLHWASEVIEPDHLELFFHGKLYSSTHKKTVPYLGMCRNLTFPWKELQ